MNHLFDTSDVEMDLFPEDLILVEETLTLVSIVTGAVAVLSFAGVL